MRIGRFQIQIVMMSLVSVSGMFMRTRGMMIVRPAQNDCADDIHEKSSHRDDHRLLVVNRLRREYTFDRTE